MSRHSFASGCLVALATLAITGNCAATQRRWTVRDSIGFSTFLAPDPSASIPSPVRFSPDGRHFIAATMRGDLGSGRRMATVWLFDSDRVDAHLRSPNDSGFGGATPLLQTGSASNRDPITHWKWGSDSRDVLYQAADDDGVYRLYRVDIAGGHPVALSGSGQDVGKFDERGGTVVYLAHGPVRGNELYQAGGPSLPDIVEGFGENDLPLLFPSWVGAEFQRSDEDLWRVKDGRAAAVTAAGDGSPVRLKHSALLLSPDGSKLLVTTFVHRVPKSWERYTPVLKYPGVQIVADTPDTVGTTTYLRPMQYSLVDLDSGAISLLVDAPLEAITGIQSAPTAAWSADGTHVALPGVYPPLAGAPASGPIYPCAIAVVEVASRAYACLKQMSPAGPRKQPYGSREQLAAMHWRDGDRELVAEYATPDQPSQRRVVVYIRSRDQWTVENGAAPAPGRDFKVTVKQALDEPPVLMAARADGKTRPLLDPNPQLAQIARGTATLYHWRDADGDAWTGALVRPPAFKRGRRYPLIVQTHGYDLGSFLADGPSASGFAARAFAARDMLVLQVDEISKHSGTARESEAGAAGYRAAIRQLVREGLADPRKVGIITWSHMGPYVLQGMIDQPGLYKAATITEADFNSYPEYLQNIDYMGKEREEMFRAQLGGEKPFGKGLQSWLRHSPGFHLDRICTPILFEFNSPVALQYSWSDYAAMRAQDKPVDLLYIRNGDHELVKPLERLAEQGRNVDWYDYWLNGHKDPDPAKSARYKLWDHMKANLPACPKDLPGIR